MLICNECAAKVRLNFPTKELVETGAGMLFEVCGVCRKKRYCTECEWWRRKKELIDRRNVNDL